MPNAGQTDARVHYYAQAPGAAFYATPEEVVFAFGKGNATDALGLVLRLAFLDANPAPEIEGKQPGPRYDTTEGHFVFAWSTSQSMRNTCAVFILTLADGQEHFARFMLK